VGPLCLLCAAGALRPTLFCGVPRVFDRIYAGVMQKVGLQQQP
jgi:long-subunit acyl-CoA synthetase (AMP-forming)